MDTHKPHATHNILEGDAAAQLDNVAEESCRLVITSPPYNIGKEYERDTRLSLDEYVEWLSPILRKAASKVALDGSFCLQVGNYVEDGEVFPLDSFFYPVLKKAGFKLRNRIVWHFNFGLHANRRFSGRYETILWFTRPGEYFFDLDPVRVPQLYPGKRHAKGKGTRAGLPSGNPAGKNPSDFWTFSSQKEFVDAPIWEIPNVKARHPEKTIHPCQFPSELAERCILAMTQTGDMVLDPFVGTGTSVIAAAKHNRSAIGIDKSPTYAALARQRLTEFHEGRLLLRGLGQPVAKPKLGEKVSSIPDEWKVEAAE